MDSTDLMGLAIAKAREGMARGQSPFGCAIWVNDELVVAAHNTVLETLDPTAHAEVNAIRIACRRYGQIFLENAVVATTCEPCPMCMAALHWARAKTVYYGASIGDATTAGFNELHVPATVLLEQGGSSVDLQANLLRDECRQLFEEFNASPRKRTY